MAIEFHEAADIFPLDAENIGELAKDIRANGLQVPIELLDGQIIDGRRRYQACEKAGVKAAFRSVSPADPVAYVLSLNLHRRHLTESQRSMVGGRARKIYDERAKDHQKLSQGRGVKGPVNVPDLKGDARDIAGKVVGVSGKSIDYATTVLNCGTEKLQAAVDADKIAVSTAARMTALPAKAQDEFVDGARGRPSGRTNNVREPDEPEHDSNGKVRGVGVTRAHEALNCLIRIPKNDALRKRGFQIVTDWIKANR